MNKLVGQYNNTYHLSIGKKPINADYSVLTKKSEMNFKAPEIKVNDRVRITKYKNIFRKGHTENWSREIFILDSVLKTNLWTSLNDENIIVSFHENELSLSKL